MNYTVIDIDTKEEITHVATSADYDSDLEKEVIHIEFDDDSDLKKYNGHYRVISKKYKKTTEKDGTWWEDTKIYVKKMSMIPYRKKPIVVEAGQWFKLGDIKEAGIEKYVGPVTHGTCSLCEYEFNKHGVCTTLVGEKTVCPGDWIIKGARGDYSVCRADLFQVAYKQIKN